MQCDENQHDFVDFIDRCLEWKPEKRMTPEDAFRHPWIKAGIKELKQKMEQGPTQEGTGETKPPASSDTNAGQQTGLPTINDSQHSRTTRGQVEQANS